MSALDFTKLRRYGPGKYSLNVDAFVDNSEWFGESCGDSSEGPAHFGLIVGSFADEQFASEDDTDLTDDEKTFLRSIAGCIVEERNNGFVFVYYFVSADEMRAEWQDIETRVASYESAEEHTRTIEDADAFARQDAALRAEFEYTLEVEPEDDDPEGHFASGDDELDAQYVANIRAAMEWNEWAWCCVKVTARHPEIEDVEGTDYLGGCSYHDAEEFKQEGGYYTDMCERAADELAAKLSKMRSVLVSEAR